MHGFEFILVLSSNEEIGGAKTVRAGVLRGFGLTFRRGRASAVLSIGLIGCEFFGRDHMVQFWIFNPASW